VSDIWAELRRQADLPFEHGRMLPATAYTSAEVADAERRAIFSSSWTCVARSADIEQVGSWVTAEVPGGAGDAGTHRSLIVLRETAATIVVYENACVHRGSTLLDGCGTTARITCPYHAWSYRLDGQLVAAPFMHDSVEADGTAFDPARHALVRVRAEVWQGFVFVSSDPEAAALTPQLAALDNVVSRYHLAGYRPVHQAVEVWDTNWKCLVENFMDAYHVFKVHRNSFGAGGDSTLATTMCPGDGATAHHVVVDDPAGEWGVAHADNTALVGPWRHSTVLAAVFPTHVMQVQPDWLWYLDVSPLATGRVRIRWDVSVAPDVYAAQRDPAAYVDRLLRLLLMVNSEDRPIVEGVARGLRRVGVAGAPLSYLERNVYDFDRYVAHRLTT
jgi:choline monooxygenase